MSGPGLPLPCCRLFFFPKFVDPSPVSALLTGGICRPLPTSGTHCHINGKDSAGNVVKFEHKYFAEVGNGPRIMKWAFSCPGLDMGGNLERRWKLREDWQLQWPNHMFEGGRAISVLRTKIQ